MNHLLIISHSHPDIVLVDEDKWPEEPDWIGWDTSKITANYKRRKSEALKQGAVVEKESFLKHIVKLTPRARLQEDGLIIYKLDPDKWQVEKRWQAREDSTVDWADVSKSIALSIKGWQTRQIAIIFPKVEQEVKKGGMTELKIYEFQAKQIEDTFRLVARVLESDNKETSVDRDVMQSWQMIKNVLSGQINNHVPRL